MLHYKAGLILEAEVSRHLTELGVIHRRTTPYGIQDVRDRVDLVVPSQGGRPTLEFQLTLRPKQHGKIFAFALRALTTRARGVRVYLEVVAARRKDDLSRVAANVARAICTIVLRFRDFGAHRLLGVRVNGRNAAIEKFDLIERCGERLLRMVAEFWSRIEETRQANEQRALAQRSLMRTFTQRLLSWRLRHEPHVPRANFRADLRAHFMPRRLC